MNSVKWVIFLERRQGFTQIFWLVCVCVYVCKTKRIVAGVHKSWSPGRRGN